MASLNKVMLIGNCTRDSELKYTPKGTAVAELGMAVNRVWNNEQGERMEETTFVDVTFWGRKAEIAGEYLKKGRPVYVEGRLSLDQWEDKQTGQKRSKLKIIGEELQLLGSRPDGERTDRSGEYDQSRPAQRPPARTPAPRPPADPDLDAEDGDPPF